MAFADWTDPIQNALFSTESMSASLAHSSSHASMHHVGNMHSSVGDGVSCDPSRKQHMHWLLLRTTHCKTFSYQLAAICSAVFFFAAF
jgi:hypothetical protein